MRTSQGQEKNEEKMVWWYMGVHLLSFWWYLDSLSSMVEGARKEEVRIIYLSKQWMTRQLSLRKWIETTVSEYHLS
jgi:hypothetical protein